MYVQRGPEHTCDRAPSSRGSGDFFCAGVCTFLPFFGFILLVEELDDGITIVVPTFPCSFSQFLAFFCEKRRLLHK
uniref:Uncharacterized protein n=1 Tax=Romanomermis culicivorax TaxID=13658 RepID=A0A915L7J7_ROMCU